jgi:hypothetical protein
MGYLGNTVSRGLADAGSAKYRKVAEDLVDAFATPEVKEEARGEAEKYIEVSSPFHTVMLYTHLWGPGSCLKCTNAGREPMCSR